MLTSGESLNCDAVDFFEGRQAVHDLFQARGAQVPDPVLAGLGCNMWSASPFQDDPADVLGDREHFVQADPTLVAVRALAAADVLVDLESCRRNLLFGEALPQERIVGQVEGLLAGGAE